MVVAEVGHQVDQHHNGRAVEKTPRQVQSRRFHLSGNKRYDVPALIGPEHSHERNTKSRERKGMATKCTLVEELDRTRTFYGQEKDHPTEPAHFRTSNKILRV